MVFMDGHNFANCRDFPINAKKAFFGGVFTETANIHLKTIGYGGFLYKNIKSLSIYSPKRFFCLTKL